MLHDSEHPAEASVPESGATVRTAAVLATALRELHRVWRTESDADRREALTAAATLVALAAIDARLQEWAARARAPTGLWRPGTTLTRAGRITMQLGRPMPAHLGELYRIRHALGPAATRRELALASDWLRGDGMVRALAALAETEQALSPH